MKILAQAKGDKIVHAADMLSACSYVRNPLDSFISFRSVVDKAGHLCTREHYRLDFAFPSVPIYIPTTVV